MPAQTDAEILEELLTARRRLITRGAASYTINGRSFQALDLGKLDELIDKYQAKVDNAAGSMFTGRGRFTS